MEKDENLVLKQLACDIKNLSTLNCAILYNKSYNKLMGQNLKKLEKVENQLNSLLEIIERRYTLLNDEDLLDLYKNKNKKETIQEMITRLER